MARAAIPSWEAVEQATPENALSITQPLDDPALPWPGLFTGVLIIGILWAPQIRNFPSFWQYFQSILSYVTPPVVAIFFFGIF